MALEMQDLMALKSMGGENALTPYEQYKVGFMQSKKPSGVAIAGLTVASVAAVAGVTAWIFGPLFGNAKAGQAKEAAVAAKETAVLLSQGNQRQLDQLTALLGAERNERLQGQITLSQNITDSISGQQSGSQTTSQSQTSAIDTTVQNIMQQTLSDAITGKSSLNPTPVMIYSAPQPCACPGCGCNG